MMIVDWVDESGAIREGRFSDPLAGLDFIMSLRALDFSFTAVSVPEGRA